MVKDVNEARRENRRARVGRERTGSDIRERLIRVLLVGKDAYVDKPLAVTPGTESRRRDLSGGREKRVSSVNADVGNEEIFRFRNDGRNAKISTRSGESNVPPGLQCRNKV